MLDMNNLPKQKHEGICKIIDLVLVVLLAVFFILSLCPYYSVSKGDVIAEIYSATEEKCISAGKYLKDAIEIKAEKPEQPKLILDIIS